MRPKAKSPLTDSLSKRAKKLEWTEAKFACAQARAAEPEFWLDDNSNPRAQPC
jgi:hypothetical protein